MNIERARKELAAEIRTRRKLMRLAFKVARGREDSESWLAGRLLLAELSGLRFAARLLRREKPIAWVNVFAQQNSGFWPRKTAEVHIRLGTAERAVYKKSKLTHRVPVYESDRIEEQP